MAQTKVSIVSIQQIEGIVSALTQEQQQLLKDTITHGAWGGAEYEFISESGEIETVGMYGYFTNGAKSAGHFQGRAISAMFKGIYSKLCTAQHNQIGRYISHCHDWWGDGTGDMLFIRTGYYQVFEQWANK